MLTFAYFRVSTADQTIENQALEVETAGYQPDQVYSETISGKVPAAERPEFDKMFQSVAATVPSKRLVVTKLDRLGRNAVDVLRTVERLGENGCAVKVLQLGDMDLTSGGGKIVLATLAAVAEIERDQLIERTNAGIARAKKAGVKFGRPPVVDPETKKAIAAAFALDALGATPTVSSLARLHGVSRATIQRIKQGDYYSEATA